MNQKIAVLDLETYYSNECSVKTLGVRAYTEHPEFEAYLMSVAFSEDDHWVGHPKDFEWGRLEGYNIWAANASFDEVVIKVGVEKGWWAGPKNATWDCVLDASRYLGLAGNLAGALKQELGIQMDKGVRDRMKGQRWNNMTKEFREEVSNYALLDSVYALKLVHALLPRWPEHERAISRVGRQIVQRGLPIDQPLLKKNLEIIRTALFEAERLIPWTGEFTPLSRKAFNNQCRKEGIPIPKSLAQDDESADKWFAEFQQRCPWARAVQNYRRINSFLCKLEAFDAGTMADGRYYGGLMYCGANPTGRWSGSGGNLNLQNLPRDEMFGVNFRPMIKPKDGYKLIVADLAQIEVRTLLYGAKDYETLELIKTHDDIYEVIAILLGLHDPANGPLSANKALRQRVKAMALGCQFGLSAKGFAAYSGMSLSEATEAVNTYRSKMKKVTQFWDQLKEDLQMSSALSQPFRVELPSGRVLDYGVPRKMKTKMPDGSDRFGYVGKMVRNGQLRDFRLWSGLNSENFSQALARDVFADMMLRVEAAGIPLVLHVHDEMVAEVPEDQAEAALKTMLEIMSTPPDWIPDLPVAAEGSIVNFYSK